MNPTNGPLNFKENKLQELIMHLSEKFKTFILKLTKEILKSHFLAVALFKLIADFEPQPLVLIIKKRNRKELYVVHEIENTNRKKQKKRETTPTRFLFEIRKNKNNNKDFVCYGFRVHNNSPVSMHMIMIIHNCMFGIFLAFQLAYLLSSFFNNFFSVYNNHNEDAIEMIK